MPVSKLEEILADDQPERSKLFWAFLKELYVGYHMHLEGETITFENHIEFMGCFSEAFKRFLINTNLKYDPINNAHMPYEQTRAYEEVMKIIDDHNQKLGKAANETN